MNGVVWYGMACHRVILRGLGIMAPHKHLDTLTSGVLQLAAAPRTARQLRSEDVPSLEVTHRRQHVQGAAPAVHVHVEYECVM